MTAASASNFPAPIEAFMLIGGERVGGPRRIDVSNPARPDEIVGTIVRGTPEDVQAAVAAAKAAQPAWGARSFPKRAEALARALDALSEDVEPRAVLFVRENGKVLAEARGELASVPVRNRLMLELASELEAGQGLDAPNGRTFIGYQPYGVVVSIVPWNAPVTLAFAQIVAALLAGNSIVVKPPETCPLALIQTIELFAKTLPPGLVNVVTGLPAEIGDELTKNPDVGKIAFTGSVPSARKIMANAAEGIKGITLELGGNDPAILLDDVDLGEATMERLVRSVYRMSGQICMAVKRIYVPETIGEAFVASFAEAADRIVVGDGLEADVSMGPMHTASALARADGLVSDAQRRGASVRTLGRVHDRATFARGHFMAPTLVTEIAEDAPLVAEEQFCPAIPVMTYRDTEDAVSRANGTLYGLGGSVWSRDVNKAANIARRLQAGTVFVNAHGIDAINRKAPYGGVKQSGIGRKAGLQGVLEYAQIQTLTTWE
jgi:acyl-CoA reductase-like NAD-dependent aldehyde dehydrogenase